MIILEAVLYSKGVLIQVQAHLDIEAKSQELKKVRKKRSIDTFGKYFNRLFIPRPIFKLPFWSGCKNCHDSIPNIV